MPDLPLASAMKEIAKRKPGKRILYYDKTRKAIVSRCNPVVCSDPHEEIVHQYPIGEANEF